MPKKDICLNYITYRVFKYGIKRGSKVLSEKYTEYKSLEIGLGDSVKEVSNVELNSYLLNRLKERHKYIQGSEVTIMNVEPVSRHGVTNKDFKDE